MKALMISSDALLHAEIAAQGSARMPPVQLVASRGGLRDAVERPLPEAPALVVFDASEVAPGEGELVERLSKQYPAASFMLLTREPQQDLLIRAMRAGMREEPCAAISACSSASLLIISAFMAGPYFAPLTPMVKLDGCGAVSMEAF